MPVISCPQVASHTQKGTGVRNGRKGGFALQRFAPVIQLFNYSVIQLFNMRKQFYLDIKNRLKSVRDENGEQLFKHFDLWNKQVEFIEQETLFQCPAVFVEFSPMQWKTIGNRVQDAQLTTRLHIVTDWYAQTADYSPTEEQALEFLDVIDRTVAVMQGFTASKTNGWMRSLSITNHDHERYVDNVEEYICNLRDTSAVATGLTPVNLQPVINRQ